MITKIVIDCDDEQQVIEHLKHIVTQLRREMKKFPDGIDKKVKLIGWHGTHIATIKP